MTTKLSAALRIIRTHQWIKNVFVLIPLFFGEALTDPAALTAGCITMVAYSFAASAIYCLTTSSMWTPTVPIP